MLTLKEVEHISKIKEIMVYFIENSIDEIISIKVIDIKNYIKVMMTYSSHMFLNISYKINIARDRNKTQNLIRYTNEKLELESS